MHETKLEALRIWLIQKERLIVAYSGGVDSAFLAAVAHEALGDRAVMATAVSPSLARSELSDVLGPLAKSLDAPIAVGTNLGGLGLPTVDKPASPCLSSRLAYGVRVTSERLQRVDRAEDALRELGFTTLRVRDHGELARIEVPEADIARASALAGEISARLSDLGFRYVTLDLAGFRSGSMNEVLPPSELRIR